MIAKLVGKKKLSYDSKKTGKHIEGTSLYIERQPTEEEDVDGVVVDKIFTRRDSDWFEIGQDYDFIYDLTGRGYISLVDIKEVVAK
jgi:hypothetical protein